MIIEVGHKPAEQGRLAKERAISRAGAAEDDVVTAAGAGVKTIELKLLRTQPARAGLGSERLPQADELPP